MKKRIPALILFFACVLSSAAAAAGSTQSNPLISLSYLTGTYWSGLTAAVTAAAADATQSIYDSALARLNSLDSSLQDPDGAAWLSSGTFESQGGERDDTVTLALGASLLWTSGSATVNGPLVDVTTGQELAAGAVLAADHRYLAPEEVTVSVTSRTAHWSVQGKWTTTSDGIHVIELTFTDVPESEWYYDAVCYVVEKGLYNGISETSFAPLMYMQRGMLTTVLYRMTGSPPAAYSEMFTDVPPDQWYTDGTIWAGMTGVVNGAGDGRFLPDIDLDRQQIAVVLYNYARYLGYDVSASADDLGIFSDGNSVAAWAQQAMTWAVSAGIMQGSGGAIMPAKGATRAEVAMMLQRFQTWADQQ